MLKRYLILWCVLFWILSCNAGPSNSIKRYYCGDGNLDFNITNAKIYSCWKDAEKGISEFKSKNSELDLQAQLISGGIY